jgi:hypothetical protein
MKLIFQRFVVGASLALGGVSTLAGVSAEEAAKLKTTLTPFGAERAGNAAGTIPAWTGAPTNGAELHGPNRRKDPFASDKILYSVDIKNLAQHAGKVPEGFQALMKKYPDTFRIDVYPTRRTAIAPQWVYDNTARNAVNGKIGDSETGPIPANVYGGIPFPIPKTGVEVVWNHQLRWRSPSFSGAGRNYQVTSKGKWLLLGDVTLDINMPYYDPNGEEKFEGEYWLVRQDVSGPPIRAGESLVGRDALDASKSNAWIYLTGQRRVRKLPSPCCDVPTPFSAGVINFDETNVFGGQTGRFDWKIVGKKEMLIPYNGNRIHVPMKDEDVLGAMHLNPDHVRWELHRVWVVEATVKAGQRHTSAKSRYYFDEDTWIAVSAERYDSSGALTRVLFGIPGVLSEYPANEHLIWGVYDLAGGSSFISGIANEKATVYRPKDPPHRDRHFTPGSMASQGVR